MRCFEKQCGNKGGCDDFRSRFEKNYVYVVFRSSSKIKFTNNMDKKVHIAVLKMVNTMKIKIKHENIEKRI